MSPRETVWGAYTKIAETLRQRILNGGLAPGFPFPSEAMLCEEFTVVRNTIRRALAALEDEGLIETLPGKGRVVHGDAPHRYAYRRIADELRGQIECGELAPGDALPSEAAIVETYGVARGTAPSGSHRAGSGRPHRGTAWQGALRKQTSVDGAPRPWTPGRARLAPST